METSKVIEELHQHLTDAGFKSSMVSTRRLPDLQSAFATLPEQGFLSSDFYYEIASRYDLFWNFEPPPDFPTAESILITTVPQPKVNVKFQSSGKTYAVVIPPTYLHEPDKASSDIVSRHLKEYGYESRDALLPEKLLAVCSGLARYGRNNIAYIDGLGSYFRPKVFLTDIPCPSDNWQEAKAMELCNRCDACRKKCPTGAIQKDRFVIRAEQCLTFLNEGSEDFPEWVDPEWHNCLIGCMVCQDICPANKEYTDWIVEGEEFSEEETSMILKGISKDKLPLETIQKLQKLSMFQDYHLLQRNLGALLKDKE